MAFLATFNWSSKFHQHNLRRYSSVQGCFIRRKSRLRTCGIFCNDKITQHSSTISNLSVVSTGVVKTYYCKYVCMKVFTLSWCLRTLFGSNTFTFSRYSPKASRTIALVSSNSMDLNSVTILIDTESLLRLGCHTFQLILI